MTTLFAVNSFIFFFLFLIWRKDSWLNVFFKSGMFSLSVANLLYFLQQSSIITINN